MDRRLELIITGLAASSVFLVFLFYAIDTCLIGASNAFGGEFHVLNIDHAIQDAYMIAIGTVKNVEKISVDESYVLAFNETGYKENVVQVTPYWFVTITVDKYLLDKYGIFLNEVKFRDPSSGCAIVHGERVNLHYPDEVTYSKGETALYFIFDNNGNLQLEGETSKFLMEEDGLSSWVMKKYDGEPIRLTDLETKIDE